MPVTEYTVCSVTPGGHEETTSSGHFTVGYDFGGGIIMFPDDESARNAAVTYAETLSGISGDSYRFIVRRTVTEVIWDPASPEKR
jgi:hypothetical protein